MVAVFICPLNAETSSLVAAGVMTDVGGQDAGKASLLWMKAFVNDMP